MPAISSSVKIGGAEFHSPCHACAFFHSTHEEHSMLVPFTQDGSNNDEYLFQVVDKSRREARRQALKDGGVSVETAEAKGQLQIWPWEDAYLRGNRFDQQAMLDLIQQVLRDGREKGFQRTRLWANMEWALEDLPGVHDIVEYETRLNKFLPSYNDIVVCTYDLNRFSAPVVVDIMRTHPQVIIGGMLMENPFFVQPDEFLSELSSRAH